MTDSVRQQYLNDAIETFRAYKDLAEDALQQTTDEEVFVTLDEESNSIAVIMKHLAGNMISRWTDFLTSDGEKPDRNRDLEFVIEGNSTREQLTAYWERGWQALFSALEPLKVEDLDRTIKIRGEEHSIIQAINRQLTHYSYHIGQLVFLAKHFRASDWRSLSVPRDRSAEFNQYLADKSGKTEHRMKEAARFASPPPKKSGTSMTIGSLSLHHVNVTVAPSLEDAAKHFYGTILGMKELPKPESSRGRGGAWYELGTVQLHLSREEIKETRSQRHICLTVLDLALARTSFENAGVEILPDSRPIAGVVRFYVRDPGGNLLEIAQG